MKHVAFLAAVAVFAPGAAQAALIDCPASFTTDGTAKVRHSGTATAAGDCEYLSPPDSSTTAKIETINSVGFFGFSDWRDNEQTQLDGAGAEGQSGTWTIAEAQFALRDYIIVFKDGDDTNLIAFLFNEKAITGTWLSPFTNPSFLGLKPNEPKDVSHDTISYRSRPDANEVPGPGMLGLSALDLALVRRRTA